MPKRKNKGKGGNTNHKPAGTPDGGQFTSNNLGCSIRFEPIHQDLEKHADNLRNNHSKSDINNSLYDGGYILRKTQKHSFEDETEAVNFFNSITQEHKSTEVWIGHKDIVDNYISVVKGYLSKGKFDLVINGNYSSGEKRYAQEIMNEFNLSKKDISNILINSLHSDTFVSSGKNDSRDIYNQGTVVMVFAPKVKLEKIVITSSGKIKKKKENINLYIKTVLNPHPNKERNQTEMQILSFREAGDKTCLFTGEVRTERGKKS